MDSDQLFTMSLIELVGVAAAIVISIFAHIIVGSQVVPSEIDVAQKVVDSLEPLKEVAPTPESKQAMEDTLRATKISFGLLELATKLERILRALPIVIGAFVFLIKLAEQWI